MQPRIIEDLPEDDYHSQKGATVPRLTYSIAKELLFRSPLHAYDIHPLLGGNGKKATDVMDEGTVMHALLFDKDPNIVISPYERYQSNEAKAFKNEVRKSGKIPVKSEKYDELMRACELIKNQILEEEPQFFDKENKYEVSVYWEDSNGVEWQSRFDCVNFNNGYMADFKYTNNASQDAFERTIRTMGYYLQEIVYTECYNKIVPELRGRTTWKFVAGESSMPHAIAVVDTEAIYEELGMSQINRASRIWKECLETGKWPGYGHYTATCPPWAFKNEMQEE